MVIALFRPKPGTDEPLTACMRDRQPVLRAERLVTDRPAYPMRAQDGTALEVFEWKSQDAIDAAHSNPSVAGLWQRCAACCDDATFGDLSEEKATFPSFTTVAT
jgi:hypothetical protein